MLGKMEGKRRRGQQGMRWLDGISNSMDMSWRRLSETVKEREGCCATAYWSQRDEHESVTNNSRKI